MTPLIDGKYTAEDLTIFLSNAREVVAKFIKKKDYSQRVMKCDFNPNRKSYYNPKSRKRQYIKDWKKNSRIMFSDDCLNPYDREKHEFRKILMPYRDEHGKYIGLYYFRVGKQKYLCKPADKFLTGNTPQVEIEMLP
jgi:hypothetical protein